MGVVNSIIDAIPEITPNTQKDSDDDSSLGYPDSDSDAIENSDSSDSSQYYDSDSSSDTYSDAMATVPKVDESWKEMVLSDLGIKLIFTSKEDALSMSQCKIEKLSMEARADLVEEILSEEGEFFGSDIYKVAKQDLILKEDMTVVVNMSRKMSKRHKVKVKLKFNGVWIKKDVIFKNDKAEFKTKRIEHFVIVGEAVTKTFKISTQGAKVKVDEESKTEVDIPPGAIESDQEVQFQIIPPDATAKKKYMGGKKPVCKSIVAVTEGLYGDNPTVVLKRPVNVKLTFEDRQEDDNTTVVPLKMDRADILVMDQDTSVGLNEEGVCNIQMSELHGVVAAQVKNEYLNNPKLVRREAELLFGRTYMAIILVFREKSKMSTGFPRIWIELVDKTKVELIAEQRSQKGALIELPNSRSSDISVSDGYRLRIDIEGALQGLRGIPKDYYLLTYLDISDNNYKVFTVERSLKKTMSMGQFSFSSDKGSKGLVHSIEVDTVGAFDRVYRSFGAYGENSNNVLRRNR